MRAFTTIQDFHEDILALGTVEGGSSHAYILTLVTSDTSLQRLYLNTFQELLLDARTIHYPHQW